MDTQDFELVVNGETRTIHTEPGTPLLVGLRNHCQLKAAKFGCGLGLCGACTVLIDDFPTFSCSITMRDAAGHEVWTLEGLASHDDTQVLQRAFGAKQAGQCGYCLPGILVRATAYLRQPHDASRENIAEYMDRNLCRCGSQQRIIEAVQSAAREIDHA